MAYKTDLNLQRLFTQLPRADDGTPIELPSIIPDTIQPVVELFPPGAAVPLNPLLIETISQSTVAPTTTTGLIIVPAGQRWIMWRAQVNHSDGALRTIACLVQQPGVGAAAVPVKSSESRGISEFYVADRPMLLQPLAEVQGFTALAVIAGLLNITIVITRFALADTIPQVPIGF